MKAEKTQQKQLDMPIAIGSCFWGHKWTKWEQYMQPMINVAYNQRYREYRQRKTCVKCGKIVDIPIS
jgi:hypothetical protein